jgi:hypothetical protein
MPGNWAPNYSVANNFGVSNYTNPVWPSDINEYKATFSRLVGNHSLKVGFNVDSWNFWSGISLYSASFSNTQTSDPNNPAATGIGLASYLLNVPDGASMWNVSNPLKWGGVLAGFVEDQWKATPRLTVNFGLRYDRTLYPPYGKEDAASNYSAAVGSWDFNRGVYVIQWEPPSCLVKDSAPCIPGGVLPAYATVSPNGKLLQGTMGGLGPHLGLAYKLHERAALRAGFGIVYDTWAGIIQSSQNISGSWPSVGSQGVNLANVITSTQLTPWVTANDPPLTVVTPATSSTTLGAGARSVDPYIQIPYSMQWNLGVQHELTPTTNVTLNFVGSGSRRLELGTTYNLALTPGPGDWAPRQPFPQAPQVSYERSWGKSEYDGLQFLLEKKLSRGFEGTVAYTWSKSMDDVCSGWYGVEGCSAQDPYHPNIDRSVSAFDITHVLVTNWIYELPIGRGRRLQTGTFLDRIIGGWQFNGISTLRSGQPYSLSVGGNIPNTGNESIRPDVVGNYKLPHPVPTQWFNPSAFAVPALYTFGKIGRNAMRSDWGRNFDMSFFRLWRIREGMGLEFRAEAFNVFNTPEFGIPTGEYTSPNFGEVTSMANSPRQLQFGMKFVF